MDTPKWVKWVFVLIVFAVASVGIVWFSGFLFFVLSKANPIGKTDFLTWWTYWESYQNNPEIAKRLKVALIGAAVACYGVPLIGLIVAMRDQRALHGTARFATKAEVAKAGLFGNTGIIVGKMGKRFMMFAGMQFVLLAAPTRSGKGVSTVIPNLLNWSESVVVTDIKLENFLITSKFRRAYGHSVFLFNPFAVTGDEAGNPLECRSHRYNPLGYISDDLRLRVTDILGSAIHCTRAKAATHFSMIQPEICSRGCVCTCVKPLPCLAHSESCCASPRARASRSKSIFRDSSPSVTIANTRISC